MQRRTFSKAATATIVAFLFFGFKGPTVVTVKVEVYDPPQKWKFEAKNYGTKLSDKELKTCFNKILFETPEKAQKIFQKALNERARCE